MLGIVGGAMLLGTAPVFAQEQANEELEEVVVTGLRGSMLASMNIKREATGVVDAISAEDIGKFPDTNLAESLQRISGVSIDRVAGEGSRVTARGFGPGFNLVTLNGRQMPTADVVVVGSGGDGEYGTFTSRSFDFSNLASEGVTGLEVYKTGRAAVPSGGIGATINVRTLRPLTAGNKASLGAKAMFDTSVETGSEVTPEVTGLYSWANDAETFGVGLFASYQKRDSASVGASNQDWNVERLDAFLNPTNGRVRTDNPATPANEATVFNNLPTGNPLVSYPNNSDYYFSEIERERVNGQAVLQFRPVDSFTVTADFLFAANENEEMRSSQGNWFNRPFARVDFDTSEEVVTTVFLQEALSSPKDIAWGQQLRNTKDELQSIGLNLRWDVTDSFGLEFDGHTSEAKSDPNGPNGLTSYDFGTGAASVAAHSLDITTGFPVQRYAYADTFVNTNPLVTTYNRQNNNGVIDIADVSSSVGRTSLQRQNHEIDEFRLEADFTFNESNKLRGGVDYRTSTMEQRRLVTAQILGDWGVARPGDVEGEAAGALEAYCLSCLYDEFSPGDGATAFRGNAAELYNAVSPYYLSLGGHDIQTWNNDHNFLDEDITSIYAEYAWSGELGSRKSNLTLGVRYEETEVAALSNLAVPSAIIWNADNDFSQQFPPGSQQLTDDSKYDNVLPSIDFSIEATDNLVFRASWSKTIARADYGQLFVADSAGTPPRATALGGVAGGNQGNPALVPLESSNIDVSVEWYYGEASYVSLGYFDKDVENFIGTETSSRNLFGLRDASSGAAGTRSGTASANLAAIPGALRNDVNLFVMTAMVANPGVFTNPTATFLANSTNGVLNQAFADSIFNAYDISPNGTDPLFNFRVQQPVNQNDANIHGVEFAFQHFFGESGFGFAGNYTMVDGDVGIDVAGDPGVSQFALEGLSDTANFTAMYEKYGFTARVSYNWRDEFLNQASRGGFTNPTFVDAYDELDVNISYDINDALAVSFEAINLTGEDYRTRARTEVAYWFIQELHPRYLLGMRYKFN
ncbi:MAG TPA: TonB-dependent receptor [Steroidobacteraceae bacterium]|nr:TonB-dependent receptor [Steroidobacteraceae bacterium]